METQPRRVPPGLLIAIVVLLIAGFALGPIINNTFSEETLATNVLLSAIPFILIFVAIILTFILVIYIVGTYLNNTIAERLYVSIERIIIGGIVLGIFSMFQPWSFPAYRYGFLLLLLSTLSFILWSHITPKGVQRQEELGTVSISEAEAFELD